MSFKSLRVLVVDDDAGQRSLLLSILRALGVGQIREAGCGDVAAALLRRRDLVFDLVLTDLQMSPGDGFDVIHAAAERGSVRQVIVMSAIENEVLGTLSRMLRNGVSMSVSVLPKPIALDALREALGKVPPLTAGPGVHAPPSLDDIRRGLAAREFVVYLEPQIDLRSGALRGFEALARWQHRQRGVLPPALFIPRIENEPEMIELTLQLLDDLLWARQKLLRAGFNGGLSLNLGDYCLGDEQFPDLLAQRVSASGARPADIMLEITETGMQNDPLRLTTGLARLRMRGFSLALDDFGMGQSTLARMQYGAFSEVKIDREFSARVLTDRTARSAIASIIELARAQGWRCIAEGVETQEILERLVTMGCYEGQGYLFTKPLDVDAAIRWWSARRPASSPSPTMAGSATPAADTGSGAPEWIFDLQRMRITWANAAAVAFWRADSLDQLILRDFASELTPAAHERLARYADALQGGRTVAERWTLRPAGIASTHTCIITGLSSAAGGVSMLVEIPEQLDADDAALNEAELAAALGTSVLMLDLCGGVRWRNPAAGAHFGDGVSHFAALLAGEHDADALVQQAADRGDLRIDLPLLTRIGGARWHRLQLQRARYPGGGEDVLLVSAIEIDDLRGETAALRARPGDITARQRLT